MPFLIVETVEKGAKQLSICPQGWVVNGKTLSWPLKKSSKKCKIENLEPKDNWLQMQCIIKRANLNSYDAAEEELNKMVAMPETDNEGDLINIKQSAALTENFNSFAEKLSSVQSTTTSAAAEHSVGAINIESVDDYILISGSDNNNATHPSTECAEFIDQGTYDYNTILTNQKILAENQCNILDNQVKIMRTLATLSVKIDKIACEPAPIYVKELSNNIKKNPFNSKISPISNLEELQHLENLLCDAETRTYYKNLYSVFCTPGKRGEVCAFQLIDVLFTREFLTQCSWSGSARGAGTKISIKLFQNVLGLFHELVKDCDPSYTVDKNNSFFKSIVKNALKRTRTKLERASAPRKVTKRKLAPNSKTIKKSKLTEVPNAAVVKQIVTVAVIEENKKESEAMAANKNTIDNNKKGETIAENKDLIENDNTEKVEGEKDALPVNLVSEAPSSSSVRN